MGERGSALTNGFLTYRRPVKMFEKSAQSK